MLRALLLLAIPSLITPLKIFPTVISPVGPFAVARSPACAFGSEMDNQINTVVNSDSVSGPNNFLVELQRLSADFAINSQPPPPSKVLTIVQQMEESANSYKDLLKRLELSPDFQQREYYALTIAQLKRRGQTLSDLNDCTQVSLPK